MAEEKQFEASQKKKNKAKEDGQIGRSRELTQGVHLSACFLMLLSMDYWGHSILDLYHKIIENIDVFSAENLYVEIKKAGSIVVLVLIIWFVVLAITSLLSEYFQLKEFRISFKHLAFKMERLDPIKGIKRILGEKDGRKPFTGLLIELALIIFILVVALFIVWLRVLSNINELLEIELYTAEDGIKLIRENVFGLLRDLALASLFYGFLNYWFSCHKIKKQLMMNFEELKRETKEDEGDPHLKGQRKQMHQEVLLHGAIENVKKAKVVVVSD